MKLKSIFPISALFLSQIYFAQETPKKESDTKEKQIDEVTITKTKKPLNKRRTERFSTFLNNPISTLEH